jgi:hypothetical protein
MWIDIATGQRHGDLARCVLTMTLFPILSALSRHRFLKACAPALVSLILVFVGPAWADPPGRAGRIADVSGTAWLFDPDANSWNRVLRNQTVGQGDHLRTATGSRVTVRVGSSTTWLDEDSELHVLQLDDSTVLLRLLKGDVALRLRTEEAADETRVQTREGVTAPEMAGLIRVAQSPRATRVVVEEGRAQFNSDPAANVQRAWLREGEQAEFVWAGTSRIEQRSIRNDAFSAWFLARDQAEEQLALFGESYVSPEMTGAEELSQNGEWEPTEDYGNVWIPTRVAPGWEPYRDGRWVWTQQWGWSWVDNAAWGFAPFHYGRWVQHRNRWAWAPGRYERRPAYAPALVTWSSGGQVRVEIGAGRRPPPSYWSPLPPNRVYVPSHTHTPQYVERFRWDRNAPSYGPNERPFRPPTQPRVQPQPQHQQLPQYNPQPQVQSEQQNWRVPMAPQPTYRDRGDRGRPEIDYSRDGVPDRNYRNRETQQQTAPPIVAPNVTPTTPAAPPPGRFEVPLFNRDANVVPPAQAVQRPAPAVTRPPVVAPAQPVVPPVIAVPAPPRQRPAHADEDESPKVRNNKLRDRQEKERQERELR